jgi:penicillin amidase
VEVAQDLEPGYLPGSPLVVPPGAEARGARPSLEEEFRKVEELIAATGRALSNNWAVDGEKSVTGKPILASDPHLPLQIPSIWYQVHLDSPNLKVAGACMPGLPEIFIGHNDRIAWGVTAALADGDDLFVERINPDNPRQYEFQGQWLEAEVVREEITVRGRRKPLIEEVMITRHGPIISPCIRAETRTLALRTTALEPAHQLEAAIELMVAQDWEQFHQALRGWLVSPLNFAYADVDGNIGYQLAGLIPMRAKGYGMVPSPGWTGEYEWTGFIPFDELPNAYNPDRHWLASSNNKIVDEDYPHFLTYSYDNGYRQQRIAQLLEAKERLSSDDFKEIQTDVYSIPGVELASYILGLQPRDEWCRRAQNFVKAWDHRATADSVAACIVETFFSHLVRRALREKLGSWSEFYLGRGIHPAQPTGHFYFAAAGWLLEKIQSRPDWFSGMTWQAAMEESLASAVAELRRLLGDDMSRWQWGRLHLQSFRHVLGQSPPLDRVFNRGPVSLGGNCSTVWQAAYVPHTGYQVGSWTASYRQIVDLSDFNRSLAVMPTGQSGHPGSRHYADMIEMWRKGEYHPMPWDRSQVEAVVEAQLTLEPPAGDGAARGAETA